MFRVRYPPEHASKKTTGDRIPGDRMSTLSNSSPRGYHAVLISFSADEPVGNRIARAAAEAPAPNEVAEIQWLASHLRTWGEVYHRLAVPMIFSSLMPGCDIFAFSLKPCLSEPSRGPLYLPCFWSPDAHTRTQEARPVGARFAPGRGPGRGVCRSRPSNTPENI